MIARGKCKWAKLQEPSEAENGFKSKYSIDLFVDDKEKAKLLDAKIPMKTEKKSGEEFFRFWSSGDNKQGKRNKPIKVVDSKKKPILDEIGNGSVVLVQYKPFEYNNMQKGVMGALEQVMVMKLIPQIEDEFTEEDGGYVAETTIPAEVSEEFEDDIAF